MVDHDYPKAKRVMDSLVQVLWTVHIRETCRQDAGEGVSALTPPFSVTGMLIGIRYLTASPCAK